jgi:hypothetical protein
MHFFSQNNFIIALFQSILILLYTFSININPLLYFSIHINLIIAVFNKYYSNYCTFSIHINLIIHFFYNICIFYLLFLLYNAQCSIFLFSLSKHQIPQSLDCLHDYYSTYSIFWLKNLSFFHFLYLNISTFEPNISLAFYQIMILHFSSLAKIIDALFNFLF